MITRWVKLHERAIKVEFRLILKRLRGAKGEPKMKLLQSFDQLGDSVRLVHLIVFALVN